MVAGPAPLPLPMLAPVVVAGLFLPLLGHIQCCSFGLTCSLPFPDYKIYTIIGLFRKDCLVFHRDKGRVLAPES